MSNGEITADIERFIQDHISSVEQLEILLLLAGAPHKDWSAREVSRELCRQPDSVAMRLEDLRDRGFLSVHQEQDEAPLLYRYISNTRQDIVVRGLGRAYQVRKDAVINLIFNRPADKVPDKLRAFSDAFRIKRNDERSKE